MVTFINLKRLHLENVSAEIAPELFTMLSVSPTITDLEVNYPLTYDSMDLLDIFFERNRVVEKVKISKLKPFHLNFLRHLQSHPRLKELHLELFKLNREQQN